MTGEREELWPWEAILAWLRIGVLAGLMIGIVVAASLATLAIRYRPPVRPAERLEAVERAFKDLTP